MKQKGFAPILIILVIAIIAAGAYFLGTKNISKLFTILPSPLFSPSPTPTADPTADWKIYNASKFLQEIGINFSIRYPQNWHVNEENPTHTSGVPWVVISQNPVSNVMSRNSPCISIGGGIYGNSIESFIQQQDSIQMETEGKIISIAPEVKSTVDITVDGLNGVKRKVVQYNESSVTIQVYLKGGKNDTYGPDGGTNYFIIESCPGTDNNDFDQILSTFKFTD